MLSDVPRSLSPSHNTSIIDSFLYFYSPSCLVYMEFAFFLLSWEFWLCSISGRARFVNLNNHNILNLFSACNIRSKSDWRTESYLV